MREWSAQKGRGAERVGLCPPPTCSRTSFKCIVWMRHFDKDQIPSRCLATRLTSHSRKVIYRNSKCLLGLC